MAKRKEWKPEEKLAIVLDGLKGRRVAEICLEYGISETQYYKWRDVGIESLKTNVAKDLKIPRVKLSVTGCLRSSASSK